jgi:hypothetical protein
LAPGFHPSEPKRQSSRAAVQFHADLTILAKLSCALARAQSVPLRHNCRIAQARRILRVVFWPLLIGTIILSSFVGKAISVAIFGLLAIFALTDGALRVRERHFR